MIIAETEPEVQEPSLEFLEFLGEWESGNGDWNPPDEFADDSFDQLYDDEGEDDL